MIGFALMMLLKLWVKHNILLGEVWKKLDVCTCWGLRWRELHYNFHRKPVKNTHPTEGLWELVKSFTLNGEGGSMASC